MSGLISVPVHADLMVVHRLLDGTYDSGIRRYNQTTGAYCSAFSALNEGWTGLCPGPDGNLYAVANVLGSPALYAFGPDGELVRSMQVSSMSLLYAPATLSNPGDLIFGPDGNLYLAGALATSWDANSHYGIVKINARTGAGMGTFIDAGVGWASHLDQPSFGPDGNFYAISSAGIVRYNGTTGAFMDVFVAVGAGGLSNPTALIFGSDNQLYVGSSADHSVLKYNGANGAFLGVFIAPGTGGLNKPVDFAYGPDGNFYVASNGSNQVLRFDAATGAFLDVFVSAATLLGPRQIVFNGPPRAKETAWVDDALPAGASGGGTGGDGWNWVTSPPFAVGPPPPSYKIGTNSTPIAGVRAHLSNLADGLHEHYFNFADPLAVATGDILFAYVYVDPAHPAQEIMLSWNSDDGWEHRAYWGQNLIPAGADGTNGRYRVSADDPRNSAGMWVRLAVPAAAVGLEGHGVTGMSFSLFGGQAVWDYAGKSSAALEQTPPSVSIVSPVNAAIVSGNVTIEATAADESGIRSVEFLLGTMSLGIPQTLPPYQISFDISGFGTHPVTLSAIATDKAGNRTTTSIQVTGASPPPAPDGLWFDGQLPAGAASGGAWNWSSGSVPYAHAWNHYVMPATGLSEHSFTGATATMAVGTGDVLYTYVQLWSSVREIMLSWNDGTWEHRAYWGENFLTYGANGTTGRHYMGPLPEIGVWTRLEVPASAVGLEGVTVSGMAFSNVDGGAEWSGTGHVGGTTPPPPPPPPANVWFDDDFPAGASAGSGGAGAWAWMANSPAPFSGAMALYAPASPGMHEQYFNFAWTPLALGPDDSFFIQVYLDPINPPRELVISFCADNWEHRAYWGENLLNYAADGSPAQHRIGDLPAAGGWVRLEVPASAVGLGGQSVQGLSLTLYDGRAIFDQAGKSGP